MAENISPYWYGFERYEMKKKIGIVTIVDNTNYGNRLQNYAIYHVLRKKFHCSAVTLVSCEDKAFYDGAYVAWVKNQIVKIICVFPALAEKRFGNTVTRWANFQKWSKLIPTKYYYSHKTLPRSLDEKYDLFVAGSDQIWNYRLSSHKFYDYFLKFADDQKKYAIAASLGVDYLPEEWKDTFKDELSKFKTISVREEAGQTIIRDLLGIDVPVLIDPTMMLTKDEWLAVSRKPRVDCSKPYVLKYYLGDEAEEEKIDVWAKENGYEVYELLNSDIPELYSAGPGEFISLISNAALVCSDSFHCIVFSIIFSRPFLVYARQGSENYMTSRLDTLLKKFGFEDRWKHLVAAENYLKCDYSDVPERLEKEQQQFIDYLSNVLK